jgi:hypothetical protein
MRNTLPQTIEELTDESVRFPAPVLAAVRELARSKPWEGSFDRRYEALSRCCSKMFKAYDAEAWQLVHVGSRTGCSGRSRLHVKLKRIELTGRLSVVTMLHLFGKARDVAEFGTDRRGRPTAQDSVRAIKWSANLFRRCFPKSFAHCRVVNGLLINDQRRDD